MTDEDITNDFKENKSSNSFRYVSQKKNVKTLIQKVTHIHNNKANFSIICEETYGYTIANSLRRIILSDIAGLAPVAVKINDIEHEFSTNQDFKENILEIVNNIRKLKIKSSLDFFTLNLKKNGAGPLTTNHIILNENQDLCLLNDITFCHLDTKGFINAKIVFAKGNGFISAEEHEFFPKLNNGFFAIDSYFSPIVKCSYEIQTSTSSSIRSDNISFEIETDGQLTPEEVMNEAIKKNIIALKNLCPEYKEVEESQESEEYDMFLEMLIKDIPDLSVRAKNCLLYNKIDYIKDLITKTPEQLSTLSGFGEVSLKEVQEYLNVRGLKLGTKLAGIK